MPRLAALLLIVALGAPARAGDGDGDGDAVAAALRAWTRAASEAARAEAAWALWQADPAGDRTLAALGHVPRWDPAAPRGEVLEWKQEVPARGEHTVYAFVPATYAADRPWPVLVWLHGAVAREGDGGGRAGLSLWGARADADDFLLLCPSARKGSEWWTPEGAALVLEALETLCRSHRVDANRVLLAGFSDGASGCWHFLTHHPGPFCGFAALMGHPLVPRVMGGPAFARNVASRPVFAVNGGADRLYPAGAVAGLMEEVRAAGGDVTWIALEDAGHDLGAVEEVWPRLRQWWIEHPRDPLPAHVAWHCHHGSRARGRDWVEVVEVAEDGPLAEGAAGGVLPSPRTEAARGYGRASGWVEAARTPEGVLEVRTAGVERLCLHLPGAWLAGEGPLVVRLNGREQALPRPAPTLPYLLERLDGRGDGEPLWRAPLWLTP